MKTAEQYKNLFQYCFDELAGFEFMADKEQKEVLKMVAIAIDCHTPPQPTAPNYIKNAEYWINKARILLGFCVDDITPRLAILKAIQRALENGYTAITTKAPCI